jgi:enoyl-CoA hydratase/carnithine racemase/3-hydroxyacyl-CoA dehydrogenase
MSNTMRSSTLQTLDLGTALRMFSQGQMPVTARDLVETVFGTPPENGSLVISGANGIVGAGKTMQLGSRLQPFGIPVIALDFPGVPDGLVRQFSGLKRAFGRKGAHQIMENIISMHYDGTTLPPRMKDFNPRFLLEAIPEILDIKKAHYGIFRSSFPEIEIRSVTSGFPSSQLGVGIAHPAFPHEINKVWEVVESGTSPITKLFWALGMIPVPVSDHWSFVLDVLFCGLALTGLRYYQSSNMPFWKIDKYIRKIIGPNPFRAHDVIGAKGANFLTWSCLHHLSRHYGDLFTPTSDLVERKDSGQDWYPLNHSRPMVDWKLDDAESREFMTWIMGPLFQMASLLLKENRGHLSHINAIGELCAQFRRGLLAEIRSVGAEGSRKMVEDYHRLHPEAAKKAWYPEVFDRIHEPDWQQLYVNAEHDGKIGAITISRESYNRDVDLELNRAIDWLKMNRIDRVIVTGDFHLSTQMVGADTNDFFPALEQMESGLEISRSWSKTARRLVEEFELSVGFVNGKRCLGGFLELMLHCHYLVALEDTDLGMPEVTLPVVPGMEGCHWPFRKARSRDWPKLLNLLLGGQFVKARDSLGWLVDFSGSLDQCLKMAWSMMTDGDHGISKRILETKSLKGLPKEISGLEETADPGIGAARKAIFKTIQDSCQSSLDEALDIQSRHSAEFMVSTTCMKGVIGSEYSKTMVD